MNFKILFMILIYYGILGIFFILGSSYMTDYTSTADMNATGFGDNESIMEIESAWDLGSAFGRFFLFLGFGVGLPEDTPTWFSVIFIMWQTIMFMLVLGFLYQSIRGG